MAGWWEHTEGHTFVVTRTTKMPWKNPEYGHLPEHVQESLKSFFLHRPLRSKGGPRTTRQYCRCTRNEYQCLRYTGDEWVLKTNIAQHGRTGETQAGHGWSSTNRKRHLWERAISKQHCFPIGQMMHSRAIMGTQKYQSLSHSSGTYQD